MNLTAIIDDVRMRVEGCGRECGIDEVVALCPHLTWNQVFLAVDYLSRTGQIQLKMDSTRSYRVKVPSHSSFRQDPAPIVA